MFVYEPSAEPWADMMGFFLTSDKLISFQFPDQDFLIEYSRNRWQSLSWKYNAIKTMEYCHPEMWSDDTVIVLHYIIDKLWDRRVRDDGIWGVTGRHIHGGGSRSTNGRRYATWGHGVCLRAC
jgi:inositol 3-alpha-galactosyltransferase